MRRMVRVLAAVLLAGGVGLALLSGPVAADQQGPTVILDRYGWWNKSQTVPTSAPVVGAPTPGPATNNVPPPPTAPADGLYLVNDPEPTTVGGTSTANPNGGPAAFGAVRYVVDEGSEGILTLKLTSAAPPDGDIVLACQVTGGWEAVQNGSWDRRPPYDCASAVTGQVDSAASTVSFRLSSFLQTGGAFDLAIVPAGPTPFDAGFEAPTVAALQITSDPLLETAAPEDTSVVDVTPADTSTPATLPADSLAPVDTGAYAYSEPSPAVVPAVAPTPAPSSGLAVPARQVVGNPLGHRATRGERLMALALLVAMAAALWFLSGRGRLPRLVAADGAPEVEGAVRIGGIGRFARARTVRRPPPLM